MAIIPFIIAAVVWTRRPSPGALAFSALLVVLGVWIIIRTFNIAAVDFPVKLFTGKILFFTTTAISILWLSFAMNYTSNRWWKRPRNIFMVLIVPFFTLIVLLTNKWSGWDWLIVLPGVTESGEPILWTHGPMFFLQAGYILSILVAGVIILWRFAFTNPEMSRLTMAAILAGALFPIVSHAFFVSGFYPEEGIDITPYSLTITGIIYSTAIFRLRFLDIVPIARTTLVENIPDGIVVLDENDRVIDINPVAAKIAGWKKTPVFGERLSLAWPELAKTISDTENGENAITHFKTPGGELYFEISLTPIYNRRQVPSGRLVILRDITEQERTKQQLEIIYDEEWQLRNDLQEEIEKRSRYTRALVHELNTPLTSILASSEMLETEVKEKTLSSLVHRIRRSSLFLEQRINELIELARGETGTLEIQPIPVNITKLIHQVVDEMKYAADEKGISLVTEAPVLPNVMGDSIRLEQVLTSLIDNAIKYTEKGQVIINASTNEEESVLVSIKDTGPGIAEERMENLFNPYRRELTDGEQLSGMGIGLALSKFIVELHKGKIWVESIPGAGSSFYFTIPIYKGGNNY
ncbi:histidine kinase N-terminal 7TM domain-containing protein [Chloroflexota bacterium]